ncbi:MAG: hypothetical protein ACHQ1D_02390 [Nitrososphaerales archaeon]
MSKCELTYKYYVHLRRAFRAHVLDLLCNFAVQQSISQNLKDENILVEILLSKKEEQMDLIEQYEASMTSATSLLVRTRKMGRSTMTRISRKKLWEG